MNLILSITRQPAKRRPQPVDGVRQMGAWDEQTCRVGSYHVLIQRQVNENRRAGPGSPLAGIGRWQHGIFGWTGNLANVAELAKMWGHSTPASDRSVSTGEVIRRGLARGVDALALAARGDLCLAVVDQSRRAVYWYRDRFGMVPAMYAQPRPDRLWVGTCLASFDAPHATFTPNRARIASFLIRSPDGSPKDFVEGIKRIEPAKRLRLTVDRDQLSLDTSAYWAPQIGPPLDKTEFIEQQRDVIRRSVERLIRSRRNPVLSVSSGLDSSFLGALWSKSFDRHDSIASPVGATMSFPTYPGTDETADTRRLADELGIEFHSFDLEDHLPLAELDVYGDLWGYGPCFHPGENYSTTFHAQIGQKLDATHILMGLGGEFLCGQPLIRTIESVFGTWREHTNIGSSENVAAWLEALIQTKDGVKQLARAGLKQLLPAVFLRNRARLQTALRLHQKHFVAGGVRRYICYALALRSCDAGKHWYESWFWELICRMHWRVQLRSGVITQHPYLDPDCLEMGARAAPALVGKRGANRRLFRQLVPNVVPEEIRTMPKHGTFEDVIWTALANRHESVEKYVADSSLEQLSLFDRISFQTWWQAIYQRLLCDHAKAPMGSLIYWKPVGAELWLKRIEKGITVAESQEFTEHGVEL